MPVFSTTIKKRESAHWTTPFSCTNKKHWTSRQVRLKYLNNSSSKKRMTATKRKIKNDIISFNEFIDIITNNRGEEIKKKLCNLYKSEEKSYVHSTDMVSE